jgi:mannitol-1-/sugar-/sorbitol-6-phosphatase
MMQPLFPQRRFRAILFDMDDTMLSSIAATERVCSAWARKHGLDSEAFLPTILGMRPMPRTAAWALVAGTPGPVYDQSRSANGWQ